MSEPRQPTVTQHGEQPYVCPACGHKAILRALWVAVPEEHRRYVWETETKIDPSCPLDATPMVWTPEPSSAHGFDVLTDFVVDGETIGRGPGEVRFTSLQEIRALERESEKRHRNGEGQIIAFREFSQDHNNRLTNTFKDSPYETNRSQLPAGYSRSTEKRKLPIRVRATEGE